MKTSPTQRSLKYLRDGGWKVAVVEKWVPSSPAGFNGPLITRDVWNWGDLLAVHPQHTGAALVQTTTGSNAAARATKARGNADLIAWLAAGNRLILHGWRKLKGRWQVAECDIKIEDVVVRE